MACHPHRCRFFDGKFRLLLLLADLLRAGATLCELVGSRLERFAQTNYRFLKQMARHHKTKKQQQSSSQKHKIIQKLMLLDVA